MRFLSSTQYFYPAHGGGENALRNLFLELQDCGNRVAALHNGERDPEIPSIEAGLPYFPGGWARKYLYSFPWKRKLRDAIRQEDPDYVITQLGLAPATVQVCQEMDVPCIVLLINYDHLCMSQFMAVDEVTQHNCFRHSPLKFTWQYPFYWSIRRQYITALQNAEYVFSNSEYMRDITKRVLDIESEVLYPPINFDRVAVDSHDAQYITMINPSKYKGGKIFVDIARELPDEQFLAVGNGEDRIMQDIHALENITHIEYADDISDVYAKTKLLLVPSQWPEPFGMVAAEAVYNDIPALVSDDGGLPEAVGRLEDLIVEDYKSSEAWINAIHREVPAVSSNDVRNRCSVESQAKKLLETIVQPSG